MPNGGMPELRLCPLGACQADMISIISELRALDAAPDARTEDACDIKLTPRRA